MQKSAPTFNELSDSIIRYLLYPQIGEPFQKSPITSDFSGDILELVRRISAHLWHIFAADTKYIAGNIVIDVR